jgi:peptidoglycan/xylan/chitin deacetylase (PgdA/CDA1 family)
MKNSEKYNFSDFTTTNYRSLLQLAKDNYTFVDYANYAQSDQFIIWRHDVDFSMHRALKLALIERKAGVKATYFVLLHSEFYNLFEKEISDILKEIVNLGHDIGLHFDSHYYDIKTEAELEEKLVMEKEIIEKFFGAKISSFCFHINNDFTLKCNKKSYAGLINAFSAYFQKEIGYCSDSNGYWRFSRLEDILKEKKFKKLHVLTHPELWQDEIMSPKQRVYRCADMRAEKTKKWYDDVLARNGRENIDWK